MCIAMAAELELSRGNNAPCPDSAMHWPTGSPEKGRQTKKIQYESLKRRDRSGSFSARPVSDGSSSSSRLDAFERMIIIFDIVVCMVCRSQKATEFRWRNPAWRAAFQLAAFSMYFRNEDFAWMCPFLFYAYHSHHFFVTAINPIIQSWEQLVWIYNKDRFLRARSEDIFSRSPFSSLGGGVQGILPQWKSLGGPWALGCTPRFFECCLCCPDTLEKFSIYAVCSSYI